MKKLWGIPFQIIPWMNSNEDLKGLIMSVNTVNPARSFTLVSYFMYYALCSDYLFFLNVFGIGNCFNQHMHNLVTSLFLFIG